MFDVGFAELFLLSLIGLLVLGPERLPAVARTLGGFVRKARMSYYNLKRTVEAELAAAEAANPVNEAKKELESVQKQVKELGETLDRRIGPEKSAPALPENPLPTPELTAPTRVDSGRAPALTPDDDTPEPAPADPEAADDAAPADPDTAKNTS